MCQNCGCSLLNVMSGFLKHDKLRVVDASFSSAMHFEVNSTGSSDQFPLFSEPKKMVKIYGIGLSPAPPKCRWNPEQWSSRFLVHYLGWCHIMTLVGKLLPRKPAVCTWKIMVGRQSFPFEQWSLFRAHVCWFFWGVPFLLLHRRPKTNSWNPPRMEVV